MTKNRITAYLMLTVTAAIWGAALPVIKATLAYFPFLTFLTYRFFLTSLFLLPILALFYEGKKVLPHVSGNYFLKPDFWTFVSVGLLGSTINLVLLFWGLENTTSLSAVLIYTVTPVAIVVAAAMFLAEKVTKQESFGLILAVIGTLIVTLAPEIAGPGKVGSIGGNLIVWASSLAWVLYVILAKVELKKGVPPLALAAVSFFAGFLSLVPFAIWQTGSLAQLIDAVATKPFPAHLGVWYMALLSGALAYWLYNEGQRRIEASEATLFIYLMPVFATPLAIFWLGEKITVPFVIGAGVIICGVGIAEWKKRRG